MIKKMTLLAWLLRLRWLIITYFFKSLALFCRMVIECKITLWVTFKANWFGFSWLYSCEGSWRISESPHIFMIHALKKKPWRSVYMIKQHLLCEASLISIAELLEKILSDDWNDVSLTVSNELAPLKAGFLNWLRKSRISSLWLVMSKLIPNLPWLWR